MKSEMEKPETKDRTEDKLRVENGRLYILTSKGIWWTKLRYVHMLLNKDTIEVPLQRLAVSIKTLKLKNIKINTNFNGALLSKVTEQNRKKTSTIE